MRSPILTLVLVAGLLVGCSGTDDKDKDAAVDMVSVDTRKVVSEPFGQPCDPNKTNPCGGNKCSTDKECPKDYKCKKGTCKDPVGYALSCIALSGGDSSKGFCSRSCTEVGGECFGVPNGQMADCFVETGLDLDGSANDKYCGFFCKSSKGSFDCPPGLKCGKPNANGNRFCVQ